MKVMKPTWVNHEGLPIFAIDVHPEGTRFATGGQGNNMGGRISIWNIVPVLEESKSSDENIPKLLCELEFHACVNAVRWSHHGLYLSSGGDDRTVEIYKCSSKYNGSSVAPSNNPFAKASHEQWRSIATLTGHSGDILDVSWSPTDKYLASASIDNSIIIWDALNFPLMIAQLKGHTSLVKGVTWDPIGKFVASQSDDRTLRIWRTTDWQLEHIVKEPFSECGGTTHVLRLDWSPDGMYLVSAHAMNAGGPTAQIVERTGWKTDKDFVGHRKAVVCVRFNKNILQREGNKSKTCFVALGSRDRAVSVWSAALKRPLVVLRDLFKNSIMDISWSACGTILTCCSYDGTVAVAQFTVAEIGKPISTNEVASLHQQTYGNNIMSSNYSCNLVQDVSVLKGQMKHHAEKSEKIEKSKAAKVENQGKAGENRGKSHETEGKSDETKGKTEENRGKSEERRKSDEIRGKGSENRGKSDEIKFKTGESEGKISEHKRDKLASDTSVKLEDDDHVIEKSEASNKMENITEGATNGSESNNAPATMSSPNHKVKSELFDGSSRESRTSSPIKGPLYKQIETVRNDGKRRITPQFLLPQDGSAAKSEENRNSSVSQSAFSSDAKDDKREASDSNKNSSKTDEDEGKKETNVVLSDKAALLEARVSDAGGTAGANEKLEKSGDPTPASISKPRMSTGSGSSDTSCSTAAANKATSGDKSDKNKPTLLPASSVLKRKRSIEDSESKPPKKGKAQISNNNSGVSSPSVPMPAPKTLPPTTLTKSTKEKSGFPEGLPVVPVPSIDPSSFQEPGQVPPGGSPQKAAARTKLSSMKLEQTNLQVVVKKTGGYHLIIENQKRIGHFVSHSITCNHEKESLDGLSWTVCVESPIVGMTGDAFRVVIVCEDSTCHILDMKGRYSLPPLVVPNFPHSIILREQYLMIITVKATLHMWNVVAKKNVIRSESLLPLLNQNSSGMGGRPIEISRSTILVGGVPLVILSNGKSFKFSPEMQAWMLFVNVTPTFASSDMNDMLRDKLSASHMAMWNGTSREVNYAGVSEAKLKLAAAIESKKAPDVKTCMHALGVTLAREGLELELRHLLQDLLGPCHSGAVAVASSGGNSNLSWNPVVVGVPKRDVLRTILKDILIDLRWQDIYCEFNELLEFAESNLNGMDMS